MQSYIRHYAGISLTSLPLWGIPEIQDAERHIRFKLPDDMRATDSLGYARNSDVDERFMPVEALPPSEDIELTDKVDLINRAIDRAKSEERAWPSIQFLWEGHPLLHWLAEQADTFFPDHSAPIASLSGRLEPNEVVLSLLHVASLKRFTQFVFRACHGQSFFGSPAPSSPSPL